jgi:hypothetical protein
MWLRRHDEDEEYRSVDRFSGAMRTLARRSPEVAAGERYVVMPHRTRDVDVHVSGASAADDALDGNDHEVPERHARMSRRKAHDRLPLTAAQRRRRTLMALLVTTLITLVLAVLVGGAALLAVQVVSDIALVGFLAHLRQRARRAAAASRQRRRVAVAPASAPAARPAPVAATAAAPARERVAPPPPPRLDESWAEEIWTEAAEQQAAGGEWDPVPVPRPTYTMKPPAPARRRRSAPLADPDAFEPQAADYAEPSVAEDLAEGDDLGSLDDILTYRAVNE